VIVVEGGGRACLTSTGGPTGRSISSINLEFLWLVKGGVDSECAPQRRILRTIVGIIGRIRKRKDAGHKL
jgi:hypothetical protein